MTLVPVPAELSTRQAANILNVSHAYFDSLLASGAIPHRSIGSHRPVLLEHLLAYKKRENARRAEALDELTQLSQELGLRN